MGSNKPNILWDLHNLPPTDPIQPGDSPLHAEDRSGQGNLRKSDKGGKGKNCGRRPPDDRRRAFPSGGASRALQEGEGGEKGGAMGQKIPLRRHGVGEST